MPLPGNLTPITVTGTYLAPDGTPAAGTVALNLVAPAQDPAAPALFPKISATATLDGSGHVSLVVPASDDPDWAQTGLVYQVAEAITGARPRFYEIQVPAASPGGTLDLATVAPVVAQPPTVSYLLLASRGAANGVASLDSGGQVPLNQLGHAPGGVASVNGSGGAVVVDLNSAVTHGSTYTMAIEDTHILTVTRTVDNPSGTNMWEFRVAGNLTGYFNEAGLPRGAGLAGQVTGRWRCHNLDNGTAQHIVEFCTSDDVAQMWAAADGSGGVKTGPFAIGGSNATKANDWGTFTNIDAQTGGSFTAPAAQGTPSLQSRNAPGGFTELQGQVSIGGSIAQNTTLCTLPTGQHPARATQFTLRFLGTGAAGTVVNIDTAGNVSIPNALVAGDTFSMDGMRFVHS